MKTTTIALSMLSVLSAASVAHAQAPAVDPESPTSVTATAPPEARGTAEDPNIDRAFILPTAMTQPSGSATYNNYELVLHGVTYGISDRVQVTLTVMPPLVKEMPFLALGAVKAQVVAAPRFHVAVQASAGYGHSNADTANDDAYTLGAGGFASVCLREDCSSLLSASLTYQAAFSGYTEQILIYGGSLIHSVSPHVKLLAEVTSVAASEPGTNGYDNLPGALVGYGLRLHNTSLAADVGFIKPLLSSGTGDFVFGLPFASVSYRWN